MGCQKCKTALELKTIALKMGGLCEVGKVLFGHEDDKFYVHVFGKDWDDKWKYEKNAYIPPKPISDNQIALF